MTNYQKQWAAIREREGNLPAPADDVSWEGIPVFYLSFAVELWAQEVAEYLDAL